MTTEKHISNNLELIKFCRTLRKSYFTYLDRNYPFTYNEVYQCECSKKKHTLKSYDRDYCCDSCGYSNYRCMNCGKSIGDSISMDCKIYKYPEPNMIVYSNDNSLLKPIRRSCLKSSTHVTKINYPELLLDIIQKKKSHKDNFHF